MIAACTGHKETNRCECAQSYVRSIMVVRRSVTVMLNAGCTQSSSPFAQLCVGSGTKNLVVTCRREDKRNRKEPRRDANDINSPRYGEEVLRARSRCNASDDFLRRAGGVATLKVHHSKFATL